MHLADASRSRSPPINLLTQLSSFLIIASEPTLLFFVLSTTVKRFVAYCQSFSFFFLWFALPSAFFLFLPFAMFHHSFRGGGRNSTGTNHFSAVNAGCSVTILWSSLHYRLIKLLINLALIALLIGFPKTVQNGFRRMKINRVVPPLSACDKRLDNTFSKILISCTQNHLFWDKVLQVFSDPNEDVKMTYIHKKNKLTEDIKIVQNELLENTRGSIPVNDQNIEDVSSCDDEQCFQLCCHSNEYNKNMGFECFKTTESDFRIQDSGKDNQRNNMLFLYLFRILYRITVYYFQELRYIISWNISNNYGVYVI